MLVHIYTMDYYITSYHISYGTIIINNTVTDMVRYQYYSSCYHSNFSLSLLLNNTGSIEITARMASTAMDSHEM